MEIKSNIINKYKTYESILKVIWYLILGLGILFTAIAAISSILYFSGSFTSPLENMGLKLNAPGIAVSISSELISPSVFMAMILNAIFAWVLILYLLSQFRKIFSAFINNKTPFIDENIIRLKKMAYSLFKYTFAAFLLKCLTSPIVASKDAFKEVSGLKFYADLSIPLWPVLFGFIILGIAEIFHHGLIIQKDNESIV